VDQENPRPGAGFFVVNPNSDTAVFFCLQIRDARCVGSGTLSSATAVPRGGERPVSKGLCSGWTLLIRQWRTEHPVGA